MNAKSMGIGDWAGSDVGELEMSERHTGCINMYAEADYSENTTANMWITNKIQQIADRIREQEQSKIRGNSNSVPRRLI